MAGMDEQAQEPLTILAVDDSPAAREAVRTAAALLAAPLGCRPRVLTARSGVEAVQLLRDPPAVDLVVLDVHLPGADVDGRLIGSLIREALPDAAILPFTGDRQPQTLAMLRALGMAAPVLKPAAPEALAQRMQAALARRGAAPPSPVQPLLASQALQLAALLEQGVRRQTVHVAILARTHLARAGLAHVLGAVGPHLPVEVGVSCSEGAPIIAAARAGTVDLLVCAPDALAEGEALCRTHGLPLLIYASGADAAPALAGPHSVIVGPAPADALDRAIQVTRDGAPYRDAQVAAVLGLTDRQCRILSLLATGATTAQIARAVGLSADRLRHVLTALYDQLGLPHARPALVAWAQEAPLHLREG